MSGDGELIGGWTWQEADHLSRRCAYGTKNYILPVSERWDIAFAAIIDYLADWDGDEAAPEKELWLAGNRGITKASRIHKRDRWGVENEAIRFWSYWYEPSAGADALGEGITDRIAIWQAVWTLTEGQWAAVWAMSEAIKRGGDYKVAAALLGMHPKALHGQLTVARRRIQAVWVAPGEHARGQWGRDAGVNHQRSLNIITRTLRKRGKTKEAV